MTVELSQKKKALINLAAALVLLIVNLAINFFLTPYIVRHIGAEANGFVALASNFVTYAVIVTVAFNSMASRHVTVNLHRSKLTVASEYYSTAVIGNMIIGMLFSLLGVLVILSLEKIINIPASLVDDVKLLFAAVFANFIISLMIEALSVKAYASNELYKVSFARIIANSIRLLIVASLFFLFAPSVYFIGLAALLSSLYLLWQLIIITRRNRNGLAVSLAQFKIAKVRLLLRSGIWNMFTTIGNVLSDGLDLLMSNIFISPLAMGVLSIPKLLNTIVASLLTTTTGALQPLFTISYAKDDRAALVRGIILNMKLNGAVASIVFAWIVVFAADFFRVWVPTQDAEFLWVLSLLSMQSLLWSGAMDPLYGVFSITNRLKLNAIIRIVLGFIAAAVVYVLLTTTDLGLYAVAGVSPVLGNICNLVFVPFYAAICLGVNRGVFYRPVIHHIVASLIGVLLVYLLKVAMAQFMAISWGYIAVSLVVSAIIVITISYLVLFDDNDRQILGKVVVRRASAIWQRISN